MELALHAGAIPCPDCRGSLRPWGMARERVIWIGDARNLTVRPCRARCTVCRVTHVLLPDWLLARRAYAARVIWRALSAHATGMGYRRIARRLGVPEPTVRDWLRARRHLTSAVRAQAAATTPGYASEHSSHLSTSSQGATHVAEGRWPGNTSPPHAGHGSSGGRPP